MTNETPQTPTLEHVADTLQFCAEQLRLCEQVSILRSRLIVADYVTDALVATRKAIEFLRATGHAPQSLGLEVPGYEAWNVVVT